MLLNVRHGYYIQTSFYHTTVYLFFSEIILLNIKKLHLKKTLL